MTSQRYIVSIFVMLLVVLTACGKKNEIYDSGEDGYTEIISVEGISFDVVSDAARNATAITNISEEMEFESDQTYVFKDGEGEYFLFCMDSIVCVAQKGTSFRLKEAENKLDAIQSGNILGIYFTSPRKKLDFVEDEKDGVYKLVATVTAQVALTSELYNDFAGRLAYLDDGEEEWTLFVGRIGTDFVQFSNSTQEVITYMTASMRLHEAPVREDIPEPAVVLGGENETSTNVAIQTVSDNTVSANEIQTPVEKDRTEEEPLVETEMPEEIELVMEEAPLPDNSAEKELTATNARSGHGTVTLDNQRNTRKDDDTVYYSDVYDMLDVGQRSYASVLLPDASGYQTVEIKADKICKGAEAVRIIKDAYQKQQMIGYFFEPPEGCTFHVIHYSVVFPEEKKTDGYINVKLRGMDGENLRFRGICYTSRTYDIKLSDTEYYAFYVVPNGCKEYAIEIGEGTVGKGQEGVVSAYYRVRDK